MISQYSAKMKGKATAGRNSLSSVSTSRDYNEDSGYSTPATSAAPTPAATDLPKPITSTSNRRGRRPATASTVESTIPSVNPVARAAALRNSMLSLNAGSSKRKRDIDSDDEDADDDNTPDAQLARALQEQEDAAAEGMMDGGGSYAGRRTHRNAKKILPMTDYASASEDDFDPVPSSSRQLKKLKVMLGSGGSNEVKFTSSGRKISKSMAISDSEDVDIDDTDETDDNDDSDEFLKIDDFDSDAPLTKSMSRSSTKAMKGSSFKIKKPSPKRSAFKVPARPAKVSSSAFNAKSFNKPTLKKEDTKASTSSDLTSVATSIIDSEFDSDLEDWQASDMFESDSSDNDDTVLPAAAPVSGLPRRSRGARQRINLLEDRHARRGRTERLRLEEHHPELHTMWQDLENLPKIGDVRIEQPTSINRELKPFQLEGVAWMQAMEDTEWGGGLLGDEMGMGKTIQAVSLIMSDFPASQPSLVLIPPVALMQWQQEISDYTNGTLKTFVFHGTNAQTKGVTVAQLKKYDVILMSYNSLESMYRKQEKGFKRKNGIHKEKSVIHQIKFHRVILDEAHNIKVSSLIVRLVHI